MYKYLVTVLKIKRRRKNASWIIIVNKLDVIDNEACWDK